MRLDRAFLFRHPAHFIALGCGAGLSPVAPGTVGTLLAVPLFILMQPFGVAVVALSAVVLFAIGIWASEVTGRALGVADHGGIVIDEIAAFLLVLAAAPSGWLWGLLAFALFRVFDIVKPWPIRQAERAIKGGLGVMTDDLLAAVYAIAVLLLANAAVGA